MPSHEAYRLQALASHSPHDCCQTWRDVAPGLLGARDFESRRDAAIIRILADTGLRLSGLAGPRFSAEDDG